jgi:UDP-2,4-diacetamido-2,4,6-trideoxy-beta-L-altropyranose hydrolase
MKVGFRTDASTQIGTGHVMRCLTIADALKKSGSDCIFICRQLPGNLIELIKHRGHNTITLPIKFIRESKFNPLSIYEEWLGTDISTDAKEVKKALQGYILDWLIVDHYALESKWEKSLRSIASRIMVIDDLANRPHDCDLLLDQNLGREIDDYSNLVGANTHKLIGPKYALLRPEFALYRDYSLARRENLQLKTILIALGGVDQENITGRILSEINRSNLNINFNITVVMGQHSPWLSNVKKYAEGMKIPTLVLSSINNMAQLMSESDLAIGAAGSSAWERCFLGLPSLILILAENQRQGAIALEKAGAAMLLKSYKEAPKVIEELLLKESYRSILLNMSKKSSDVCSIDSIDKIILYLNKYKLSARKINQSDEMLLFEWANDPLTRMNGFAKEQVTLPIHKAWLAERLEDNEKYTMFIIEENSRPLGQVRFEKTNSGEWKISYLVSSTYRGQGLGFGVLNCGINFFKSNQTDIKLWAYVKKTNIRSRRVFKKLEFEQVQEINGVLSFLKYL